MAKAKTTTKGKVEEEVGSVVKKVSRSEEVRQGILEAHENIENSYVTLAELLSEAYHKEFYLDWGYTDFKEYCENEVDTQYRKAMYLVDVADCIKKHKIPTKTVEKLGWTKMKDLAQVITEDNLKEWLTKAKDMTSRELTEAVKISKTSDGGAGGVPQVTTMTFRMGEAEANVITEALEEAKKLMEGGDSAQQTVLALEMICQDWLESKGAVPERTRLSDHLKYLERIYGVSLTVKGKPKLIKKEEEEEEEEAPAPKKSKTKKVEVEEEEEEAPAPKKKSKGKKVEAEEPAPKKAAKKSKKAAEPEEEEEEEPAPKNSKKNKKGDDEEEQDLNDLLGI